MSRNSFLATQKYTGASCSSPLVSIRYDFAETCDQTSKQSCLVHAPFATQAICVEDWHSHGISAFGSSAYAEVV
ncbi:UNVERIFIED_CONTAM: hypothetical protein HDU68_010471, partial [Siphonaria sp. JEL0065]